MLLYTEINIIVCFTKNKNDRVYSLVRYAAGVVNQLIKSNM
jgi:hypothetical protein